jgi:hypothetical protein
MANSLTTPMFAAAAGAPGTGAGRAGTVESGDIRKIESIQKPDQSILVRIDPVAEETKPMPQSISAEPSRAKLTHGC